MTDQREKTIYRVTIVGSVVNLLLVIFKFIAGVVGRSSAMVADAVHSLSDLISDVVVLVFVKVSSKPEDSDHAYGHGKYETLASVIVGVLLLLVGLGIFYDGAVSVVRFFRGEIIEQPGWLALVAAVVSIVAKEWLFRYTIGYARKVDSAALKANAWHHRSDAISSVATLIGVSFAIFLGARWRVMDPIASIAIAIMIAVSAVKIAWPSLGELLETSLPEATVSKIRKSISEVPGVLKVHNLRARRNGHSYIVDVNIHVSPDITVKEGHEIATNVEKTLQRELGPDIIIYVHTEPQS